MEAVRLLKDPSKNGSTVSCLLTIYLKYCHVFYSIILRKCNYKFVWDLKTTDDFMETAADYLLFQGILQNCVCLLI